MAFDIGDKYGDSRDIEKIITDLEGDIEIIKDDIQDLQDELSDLDDNLEEDASSEEIEEYHKEEDRINKEIESKEAKKADVEEELEKYTDFRDEFEGYCDNWKYGATLIREDYFTDYIKNNLIPDVYGEVFENIPSWLESNIDWDGVASDFQVDYTSGEIEGITYWCL